MMTCGAAAATASRFRLSVAPLIIFQTGSIYDTVGDDPAWVGIAAIDNDNYYQVPNDPTMSITAPWNEVLAMAFRPLSPSR